MKSKWRLFLLVGLILLLASSVIGCNSGYTQEDINTAWQEGYTQGFADGIAQYEPVEPGEILPSNGTDGENGEEKELPSGAIQWDEAKDRIGDRTTVCGPVKSTYYSTSSKGKPTFLNIGKAYPDQDRFVVIIWGSNRSDFPEPPEDYYSGKTICVTGLITEYEGVAEIEVNSPDQIQDP